MPRTASLRRPFTVAAVALVAVVSIVVPTTSAAALAETVAPAAPPLGCAPAPAYAVVEAMGLGALHDRGIDGAGVTVGVISTSFNNPSSALPTDAAADVASGALPGVGNPCGYTTPVQVISDLVPNDDEGRAMLQVVHAIAPAARLVFTQGGSSDADLAAAIDAMVNAGVDIIVDDMLIMEDTAYAASLSATAADRAVAQGIAYTVASGNFTYVGAETADGIPQPSSNHLIGSWETLNAQSTTCPAEILTELAPAAIECVDFDPGVGEDPTQTYKVGTGIAGDGKTLATVQWSDAPGALASEFWGFIVDENGAVVNVLEPLNYFSAYAGLPIAAGYLFEDIPVNQVSERSLVLARTGLTPSDPVPTDPIAVRMAFMSDSSPRAVAAAEYYQSSGDVISGSSIIGRAANASSITVAARPLQSSAGFGCQSSVVECFSSTGPRVRYFSPLSGDGTPSTLLAQPQIKTGPDITAYDGIPTTFFGQEGPTGVWVYFGTSAATPVVGATLALAMQGAPDASLAQLRAALIATAAPLTTPWSGTTNAQVVGAGAFDGVRFVNMVAPPAPTPAGGGVVPRLADSGSGGPGMPLLVGSLLTLFGLAVVMRRSLRRQER